MCGLTHADGGGGWGRGHVYCDVGGVVKLDTRCVVPDYMYAYYCVYNMCDTHGIYVYM